MKRLILIKDGEYSIGEVRTYGLEGKDTLGWAKYNYLRRIEKEGWYADEAYIVEDTDKLPLAKWLEQEERRQSKAEAERQEQFEKEQYERLKAKFESKDHA